LFGCATDEVPSNAVLDRNTNVTLVTACI
jgi:hypothetical protein